MSTVPNQPSPSNPFQDFCQSNLRGGYKPISTGVKRGTVPPQNTSARNASISTAFSGVIKPTSTVSSTPTVTPSTTTAPHKPILSQGDQPINANKVPSKTLTISIPEDPKGIVIKEPLPPLQPIPSSSILNPSEAASENVPQPDVEFGNLANRTKNVATLSPIDVLHRFSDVTCPRETAITVSLDNKPCNIHANLVQMADNRSYIATQAPPNREGQERFWKMAMERSSVILDLTKKGENLNLSRFSATGSTYPQKDVGDKETFGNMEIECVKIGSEGPKTDVYTFKVTDKNSKESKLVTRVHYHAWEDHQGTGGGDMGSLVDLVDKHANGQPPIVHCRAGVGRTGTFITASTLQHQVKEGRLNPQDIYKATGEIILKGREQRGPLFVQTADQLRTLYDFGSKLKVEAREAQVSAPIQNHESAPLQATLSKISEFAIIGLPTTKFGEFTRLVNEAKNQLPSMSKADRDQLFESLDAIKKNAISSGQWGVKGTKGAYSADNSNNPYISFSNDSVQTNPLNPQIESLINFTMSSIKSDVPNEVRNHEAYHQDLLLLPSNEVPNEAFRRVRSAEKEAGVVTYLLRDSSTRRGPSGEHIFTLTLDDPSKTFQHTRLSYKEGEELPWSPVTDKKNKFATLDELLKFELGDKIKAVKPTE